MSTLSGPKSLGDRLLVSGLITRTQLDAALEHQAAADHRRRIGRMLVELGFLNDRDLSHALSVHLAIPVLPFSIADARADALASIPAALAHRHRALPCRIVGGSLLVAAGEAPAASAREELGNVSGRPVLFYLASEAEIEAALLKHYGAPPVDPDRLQRLAARVQQIADHPDDGCVRAELGLVRAEIDALINTSTTDRTHCIPTGGQP